jgi:nucleoside phosphorylase
MRFLQQNPIAAPAIVMGLCGSLSDQYGVGSAVVYESCVDTSGTLRLCDRELAQRLGLPVVRAFTSDRVISSAAEKRDLAQTYQADVVDMEGMAVLSALSNPVAMVRVVSDDIEHDLPNLSSAIVDGNLRPLPFAIAMLRQPIGAVQLVRGALTGLDRLRAIAREIAIAMDA